MSRIQRAANLAASLGKNQPPFAKVITHVETLLDKYAGEDPLFLSAKLMELLQTYKQGEPLKYVALAAKAASLAEDMRNWHRARSYWQTKARWHALAKDLEGERSAKEREAETHVAEADDIATRNPPDFSVAAWHVQRAIEAYRRLGNTKARIEELHQKLIMYQKQSVRELSPITTEID